ncbi:MAG: hypothetical protein K6F35_03055 [Lachnospiraceae bacterium]|nr:hypothetical protein [Lachnospiraceae bacterium]
MSRCFLTYKLTLKKNQALDLTAAAAAKKNVVSSCVITAKATGSAPAGFDWKSTNEESMQRKSQRTGSRPR